MDCAYTHCKLNEDLTEANSKKAFNAYYHLQCYSEMKQKKEIEELFLKHINPTETKVFLRTTIVCIINKGISSEFLLFALKKSINSNYPIYNAQGLHLIINNKYYKEDFKKEKNKQIAKEIKKDISPIKSETEVRFNFKDKNKKNTLDIIPKD